MSTSDATDAKSNSHTESKKQTPKRCKTESRADQSLLIRPDESSDSLELESSIGDDSSAMGEVQVNSEFCIKLLASLCNILDYESISIATKSEACPK